MTQITDVPVTTRPANWNMLLLAQLASFALIGFYSTWTQRYLYGDGANFFLRLLKYQKVSDWFPARYFSHVLTQFPAVFLLGNLGCRDVGAVGATYGATLYLLPLVGLLLTWWAARQAPQDCLVYPLITSSVLYLDVSGFIISESSMAVSLFWPILYLLLFSKRLTMIRTLVLIGLSVLVTHTYECYIFLAWPLILVAAQRGRVAWMARKYGELIACSCCGLLMLAAFAISLQSVLIPQDEGSRANFAISVLLHLLYPPVWFSLLTLISTLWCIFLPESQRGRRLMRSALIVSGITVSLLPVAGIVAPSMQYISRIQVLYVPLLMGMAVALRTSFWRPNPSTSVGQQDRLWMLAAGACLVASVFQAVSTFRWDCYRTVLIQELSERRGVISYDQSAVSVPEIERLGQSEGRTALWNQFISDPRRFAHRIELCQFDWGWATPSLCVALSALNLGSISTIVCAPGTPGWQPFDPRQADSIPDLRAYGVSTDPRIGGK